jgi:hypothetical protein
MADIASGRAHQCVKRMAKHTNTPETIYFSSIFAPLPLAVDAATMFHNYAYQLYLIGKRQSQGSQRRRPFSRWPGGSSTGATAPGCGPLSSE